MEGIRNRFNGLENFKSARKDKRAEIKENDEKEKKSKKVQVSKDDMYMKWPLRGLAYSNEIGEIIRPMSGLAANLLWIPAIGYIAADVGDKYKHNAAGEEKPSKRRAGKEFSFQMLASVLLPTAAVKAGQKLTNVISSKTKTKLSLNAREVLTNRILDSMNKGTHEKYLDAKTGLVDRKSYADHIMRTLAEKEKHEKTHNKLFAPFEKVIKFIKRPFATKPDVKDATKYVQTTIDNIMDVRDAALKGNAPKNVSKKLFNALKESTKAGNIEETKSVAFDIVKGIQNKKLFKNNALKSLGGLVALGLMMKPIDNFVEKVLIEKYIGPTIDSVDKTQVTKAWKSLKSIVGAGEDNKTKVGNSAALASQEQSTVKS